MVNIPALVEVAGVGARGGEQGMRCGLYVALEREHRRWVSLRRQENLSLPASHRVCAPWRAKRRPLLFPSSPTLSPGWCSSPDPQGSQSCYEKLKSPLTKRKLCEAPQVSLHEKRVPKRALAQEKRHFFLRKLEVKYVSWRHEHLMQSTLTNRVQAFWEEIFLALWAMLRQCSWQNRYPESSISWKLTNWPKETNWGSVQKTTGEENDPLCGYKWRRWNPTPHWQFGGNLITR